MSSNPRALLPKISSGPSDGIAAGSSTKRRIGVQIACNLCRKRKLKCSGERPKCSNCRGDLQECTYTGESHETRSEAIKRKHDTLLRLFDLFRTQSDDVTNDALRSLREGASPEMILSAGEGGMLYPNPSATQLNRALLPPTLTLLEYQLELDHPNAYPPLAAIEISTISLKLLGIAVLRSPAQRNPNSSSPSEVQLNDQTKFMSASSLRPDLISGGQISLSKSYVDDRLNGLQIGWWTKVSVSNHFAAEALSLYLQVYQPWLGTLEVDTFLDDLIAGRTRFCSELLVNALLAWSCQSYANYESTAFALSSQFLAEALRLYEEVRSTDSLTTVAATMLMSMTVITSGMDRNSKNLRRDSVSMATRLNLFYDPEGMQLSEQIYGRDRKLEAVAASAAWALFCFEMLISMSYHTIPLVRDLPAFGIPGDLNAADGSARGLPIYLGSTFISTCKFWIIVREMLWNYFYEKNFLLSIAASIYEKLLVWADELQYETIRDNHSKDHVISLHIWFHTAVMDLFRPFLKARPQPQLPGSPEGITTPAAVVAASVRQLKRLILIYRSSFESANFSITYHHGMLYLLNHIFQESSGNQDADFFFLLCMHGYQNLMHCFPMLDGVVQGLFVIAVRSGILVSAEAEKLFNEINEQRRLRNSFSSDFPVDLDLAQTDLEAACLNNLAQQFSETVGKDYDPTETFPRPDGWIGNSQLLSSTIPRRAEDGHGIPSDDSLDRSS